MPLRRGKVRCARCGQDVEADWNTQILSCTPTLTPYTHKDQTTKVEGYVHGLGRMLNVVVGAGVLRVER
jgi:hypothetical protein